MNTIAALTDFSVASDNALRYAATLAQKAGASLTLLHVYQMPVTMNDVPVMLITADTIKQNADDRLEQAKESLVKEFTALDIYSESLLGDIVYEIHDWCKENNPLAVVIGTHESTGAERLFFGSSATGIVRRLTQPIFIVPQTYTDYRYSNAVLATDLSHMEAFPTDKIVHLLQALQIKLHVVHIDEKESTEAIHIPGLEPLAPTYNWIQEEDVNKKILEIVEQPQTDLLIILPHEHNLVERLFFNLHTENIIRHTPKPVLSIKN